ncbi:pantoate--beta-alanine ligase [Flammeovirga kamogawensis]|uniref:Pantothenate synthetase n=1 Tax=Flammeovirga kamogawensis TaxID=373891 RepID=A0ABX8GVV9_9BACT|nr:pantoate--beta-alanine ligase [Flammeovirga kamogawensis]MBB6461094.1 pantoate--beta-alanine ligase [Flammeovirga kamogawensis]QWG07661.1 pantoate--beta-alanine ligase [Flammeovirga kamogawensis]TRX69471.1 pantoate--beta-alanine ligase [Flammeovirga kamogawensis]
MDVFNTVSTLKKFVNNCKFSKKTIGFVPTMGALHEGHLTLIRQSNKENDITICSIFVNPTQFNNAIDLKHYPVKHEEDFALLESAGCHVVFLPSVEEMYPKGVKQNDICGFNFGEIENQLEGAFRPGHFNGVGIVVSKLFHMVSPMKAYFGLKDLQQFLIIRKMATDLSFGIEIIGVPTVRENDGLAMSSRNLRLTKEERAIAPFIFSIISEMKEKISNLETPKEVLEWGISNFHKNHSFHLEYLDIVNSSDLKPVNENCTPKSYAIVIAAHLGKVRLIDNLLVE